MRRASPRDRVPHASARSIRAGGLDGGRDRFGLDADRGRELAQDPLDLLPLRAGGLRLRRFESSTTSNGSTNSVWPESELSWTMPGTLLRELARTARTGRPPRCGDEVLLQVLAEPARSDELLEPLGDAVAAGPQLRAELAQLRGGVVAQVGAVLLDGLPDRVRERPQPGLDRGARARAGAARPRASSAARARRRLRRCRATSAQHRGVEHAAARRRGPAASRTSCDPASGGCSASVEERDRLGGQRLAPRDLGGVGRGRERQRERGAVLGRGRGGEPLADRREFERRRARRRPRYECRAGPAAV